MSKLTDKLHQLGRTTTAPLGFGRPVAAERTPAMLLIGEVAANAEGDAKHLDALLLKSAPSEEESKRLGEALWGAVSDSASEEDLDRMREAGCDFVFVPSSNAPAHLLRDDGMTRGFPLPLDLSDQRARAIDDLPFEFLVVDYETALSKLTIEALLQLQSAISQVGKHIFLRVNECPSDTQLQILRDAPVDALIMDVASAGSEKLQAAKEALARLEPRKPRSQKEGVLLPQGGRANDYHEDGDEGDDEDWDDSE